VREKPLPFQRITQTAAASSDELQTFLPSSTVQSESATTVTYGH
jgi:hypothetical protein